MRILKIEIQNINSLRCEKPIVIDFESEHFQDVGLFAITGSTGAGKTTLLDAICIGLYQSVPRFNQKNSRGNLQDVVSYGADHAMARITFQVLNGRYEAFWSMRLRQKGGKPLSNPREEVRLKDLNNAKILAEKKTQLKTKVEEITQLNYQQFLRSVMLAQGEFAAFLSADNKDKGTLLEQITGEEIYKRIGESLGTRIGEERYKLEQIDKRINVEDLLSDEQKHTLNQERDLNTIKLKEIDGSIQNNETILSWYKKQEELDKTKGILESRFSNLKEQQDNFKPQSDQLKRHTEAEPFQSVLKDINRIEQDQAKNQAEQKKLTDSLSLQEIKLKQTKEQEQLNKKASIQADAVLTEWIPKLEQVAQWDIQLEAQSKVNAELELQVNKLSHEINEHLKVKNNLSEELNKGKLTKTGIETYLKENKHLVQVEEAMQSWVSKLTTRKDLYSQGAKFIDELNKLKKKAEDCTKQFVEKTALLEKEQPKSKNLEKDIQELAKKIKQKDLQSLLNEQEKATKMREALRELHSQALEFEVISKRKLEFTAQEVKTKAQVNSLEKQHKICCEELSGAKKVFEDGRKIVELENKIKSFEEERKKLVEGEPCSLCGSTAHPYVQDYADLTLDESQQELEKRELKFNGLQKQERQISIQLAEQQKEIEQLENNIKETGLKLDELMKQFSLTDLELNINNKEEILNEGLKAKTNIEELGKLIRQLQDWQKDKELKDGELKIETQKCTVLNNELIALQQDDKSLKESLLLANKRKENVEVEIKKLELELSDKMQAFELNIPSPELSDAFVDELNASIINYRNRNDELNTLTKALSETSLKLQHTNDAQVVKTEDKKSKEELLKQQEAAQIQLLKKRIEFLPKEVSTEDKRKVLQENVQAKRQQHESILTSLNAITTQLSSDQSSLKKLKSDSEDSKKVLTQLIDDLDKTIAASSFNERSELEQAMLSFDSKSALQTEQQKLEALAIELNTLETQLANSEFKQKEEKTFDVSNAFAIDQKKELLDKKDAIVKRSGEMEQMLAKDKEIEERNKLVVQEKRDQEKVVKKYRDLLQLLGGSKHAFNTYVQRLTLKNLITMANRHLFKLNRRYSLKMNEHYKSGEELNFMLVDHYQTDETRLVDTSSGGEKFLISLALALGLSDLASKNVSIGSLFIDEGFGTLDNSTLETVIATLSTLQSQGKMIGVISHVENLKDRISTQIKVMKTKNGISEVEIV